MKILYLITKGTWGGAQRYVYDLATAMQAEGHDVLVVYGMPGLLDQKLTEAGIRHEVLPALARDVSLGKELRSFFDLWRILRREQPDVLHVNSSKAGGLGVLAGRLLGIPRVVFTAHGWAFNEDRSALGKFVILLAHYVTVLLSHITITASEALKKQAQGWPMVQGKILTVRDGIAPIEFLSKDAAREALIALDQTLAAARGGMWVGTIAELHRNKGIGVGIEAWKNLATKAAWVVLGSGEEEHALRGKAKGNSSIHLLGFVPDASKYVQAFDIFLLPSRTEALGYVLLEAGLASLPVIATNVGGIPEVIETEADGLLVPARNPEALSNAVLRLLNEPALRERFGTALHEKVLREFSMERMIEETKKIYRI